MPRRALIQANWIGVGSIKPSLEADAQKRIDTGIGTITAELILYAASNGGPSTNNVATKKASA